MATVILKFKEAAIKEIPLEKDIMTIGRKDDNDIVIDNQASIAETEKKVEEVWQELIRREIIKSNS